MICGYTFINHRKGRLYMKIMFSHIPCNEDIEEDLTPISIRESIEKTRYALDIAYAGFNDAVDVDLIDSYIYQINALQKKYEHLTNLAETLGERPQELHQHSPIRALVSHVLG